MTLSVKLEGVKECIAALAHLSASVQRKHMRIAMNAAGGMLKTGAVSRVPQRTKLLKQSLAVKVTQKKNGEWYTVVGPRRKGMTRAIVTNKNGKARAIKTTTIATGKARFIANPARYAHLAEKGTRSHVVSVKNKRVLAGNGGIWGRRVTIKAKASRFLATTASTTGPAAVEKAINKLREAVLSHANK